MRRLVFGFMLSLFTFSFATHACDAEALKFRMDKYQKVFKAATEELDKEVERIGCSGKKIRCDHQKFTELHQQYLKSRQQLLEYIVVENENAGCPEQLVKEIYGDK